MNLNSVIGHVFISVSIFDKGEISFAFQSPDDDVRGKHIWCDLVPEVRNIKYIKEVPEVYSFG